MTITAPDNQETKDKIDLVSYQIRETNHQQTVLIESTPESARFNSNYPPCPRGGDHDWKYYDGALGYESSKCSKCGMDWNDLPDEVKKDMDLHERKNAKDSSCECGHPYDSHKSFLWKDVDEGTDECDGRDAWAGKTAFCSCPAYKAKSNSEDTMKNAIDPKVVEHFFNWLEKTIPPADQEKVQNGIMGVLQKNPALLNTKSWPELKNISEKENSFDEDAYKEAEDDKKSDDSDKQELERRKLFKDGKDHTFDRDPNAGEPGYVWGDLKENSGIKRGESKYGSEKPKGE